MVEGNKIFSIIYFLYINP